MKVSQLPSTSRALSERRRSTMVRLLKKKRRKIPVAHPQEVERPEDLELFGGLRHGTFLDRIANRALSVSARKERRSPWRRPEQARTLAPNSQSQITTRRLVQRRPSRIRVTLNLLQP
jgi:hypothetical protein